VPEPERKPFSYSIVRVVPRIERGERFNAGVIVHCRQLGFLGARVGLDEERLLALAPGIPAEPVRAQLEVVVSIAAGHPGAGAIAALPPWERFDWLVAPASTMIQPSEVHTGLTDDPGRTLEELFVELVAAPADATVKSPMRDAVARCSGRPTR
jgi:hypothetical protein